MKEIPKIIHQIYGFWDKNIPTHIQSRIDVWKKLHPDYKYILWDKKKSRDFIKKNIIGFYLFMTIIFIKFKKQTHLDILYYIIMEEFILILIWNQ